MKKHFVTFLSPGTFVHEETIPRGKYVDIDGLDEPIILADTLTETTDGYHNETRTKPPSLTNEPPATS